MILENFSVKHRSIANQRLAKILLMSLGGSALLHTVAIAGVSYWASNHPNDRIEIVEIERVELEQQPTTPTKLTTPVHPVIPAPPPQVAKPSTIIPTSPIPAKISVPPAVIKITKSAAVTPPTLPLDNIISSPVKPVALPVKVATSSPPPQSNPTPSFPDRLFSQPVSKTTLFKPKIESRIQPSKVPAATAQKNSIAPIRNIQPQIANNSIALTPATKSTKLALSPNPASAENPTTEELLSSTSGNQNKLVATPDSWRSLSNGESTIPANNQAKLPSESDSRSRSSEPNILPTNSSRKPKANPQTLNNIPAATPNNNNQIDLNSNQTKPDSINPNAVNSSKYHPNFPVGTSGEKPGNNSQAVRGNSKDGQPISSSSSRLNSSVPGSDKGNNDIPGNIATGNNNPSKIQCLRNCEIRYPEELESSDIGKDKILVRVTIDPNGSISNAEIARSSGNQKLDQFTLNGVKQMQLNATGKTRTHKIRISTLLNN